MKGVLIITQKTNKRFVKDLIMLAAIIFVFIVAISEASAYKKLEAELKNYETKYASTKEELAVSNSTISKLNSIVKEKDNQISEYESELSTFKENTHEYIYLGEFEITFYCAEEYPHICGGSGCTASGAKLTPGVSVAVDRNKIPLGSNLYIEGFGERVAQDTGGAVDGNHIDICVPTHAEALSLGTVYKDVWVIN